MVGIEAVDASIAKTYQAPNFETGDFEDVLKWLWWVARGSARRALERVYQAAARCDAVPDKHAPRHFTRRSFSPSPFCSFLSSVRVS